MVNHRALTSAMIDSCDFLVAKRRLVTEGPLPAGQKIGLTGGSDFSDHRLIQERLDTGHVKHPDMVFLPRSLMAHSVNRWAILRACGRRAERLGLPRCVLIGSLNRAVCGACLRGGGKRDRLRYAVWPVLD